MKISFVVPVYKSEDRLKACLDSLIDQTGADIEIVVVYDGESIKAEQIVEDERDKLRKIQASNIEIKDLKIEHSGACAARNAGFYASTGEIVSFFNSDYKALPGMIQEWLEGFKDNPEAGFIITGYGWTKEGENYPLPPHQAEEFDPFTLENYNYIDCGCPLKREVFQPFDVNCKSLQDWDFFLRIVKSGVKGAWKPGITYLAEVPKAGGLSNDSHNNWIERVEYVKKNNNIPLHDVCVVSAGAQQHAKRIAKMIGADYNPLISNKKHKYKMVILIGAYTGPRDKETSNKNLSNFSFFDNCSKECVKVIYWVGADIYWLRDLTVMENEMFGAFLNKNYKHFVECEQMQKEMKTYHIDAEIMPIPPPGEYKILPLPAEFTVAIMKTDRSDFDKYCGDLMDSVMAAMPMIKFKVFGDGKCRRPLDNVENCGYVKMEEFIPQCSAIMRIVRHDGMMMALNEFVMSGRDALSNLEMPYIEFIDTSMSKDNWDRFGAGFNLYNYPETKKKIIVKLYELSMGKAGNAGKREEAADYYNKLLDKATFQNRINGLLK